jgi:2-keto-4-pentenoate hydratase
VPTAALHRQLADEWWEADRAAGPVAPLTDRHTDLTIEDAYAIQTINIDRRTLSPRLGRRGSGHGDVRARRHRGRARLRYESLQFALSDGVADNASAFYLGPVARRSDELEDLRLLGRVVRVDGRS